MTPQESQLIRALANEDKLKRELFRANGRIEALQKEIEDLKAILTNLQNEESL